VPSFSSSFAILSSFSGASAVNPEVASTRFLGFGYETLYSGIDATIATANVGFNAVAVLLQELECLQARVKELGGEDEGKEEEGGEKERWKSTQTP